MDNIISPEASGNPLKIIWRDEAKALGLDRYYTGFPCVRGHRAERFVDNIRCVECPEDTVKRAEEERRSARQYYATHRPRILARSNAYNEAHRQEMFGKRRARMEEDLAAGWYVYVLRHPLTKVVFYVGSSYRRRRLREHLWNRERIYDKDRNHSLHSIGAWHGAGV